MIIVMEIETTISKIGDSYFVRIPAEMAKYFKLTNGSGDTPKKAKIKDLSDSEAKISFTLW